MRDKKGRFLEKNGNTKYKRIERNNKNLQKHRYIWEKYYNRKIPEGHIIHHIDKNGKNNKIENLQLMTHAEHNYLHGYKRKPWNKGKKCPKISKSKIGHKVSNNQKIKLKNTWKNKYINNMEVIDELFKYGLDMDIIGKILDLSYRSIHWRYKKYLEDYNEKNWEKREYERFREIAYTNGNL